MRGRELAKKFSPIFVMATALIRLAPMPFRKWLYGRIKNISGKTGIGLRYIVLSAITKIGENVSIHPNVYLLNMTGINIGDNVSIHPFCYIEAMGKITIGNDVSIAHGVTIMSTSHNFDRTDIPIKDQGCSGSEVIIGNGVWIGAKASILSGVEVGNGAIIGASALVNRNVPDFAVSAGVPAKVIKYRKQH